MLQSRPVVLRLDRSPLSKATRLDSGAIRVPARLTRTGVFPYRQADGTTRREYRPADEVFAPSALEALRAAPVTAEHPTSGARRVTAETWAGVAIGHVGDDVRADADRRFVEGSVVISDAGAISRVDSGALREVSVGYDVDLEMTSGVSPEGEPYDAIQRRIRPNHVALVPRGRAGSEVSLRLDSAGDEIPDPSPKDPAPMKIKIAGREYDAGSPEAEAAIAALSARADAAEAEAKAVRSRTMREKVRAAKIETRADADDNAVMVDVVKRIAPDVDLASASPDFVAGAFAVAIAIALKSMGDAAEKPKAPAQPGSPDAPAAGAAGARADAIDAAFAKLRADRAEDAKAETADDIRDRVIAAQRKAAFAGL